LLHQKKKPALFIKLDISKAFDSIGWTFLLEVMQALGFSTKWRDWVSTLLGHIILKGISKWPANESDQTCQGLMARRSALPVAVYPSHRSIAAYYRIGSAEGRAQTRSPKVGTTEMFTVRRRRGDLFSVII
jgi:hypothetical protein